MKLLSFIKRVSIKLNVKYYSSKHNTVYALSSGYGRCGVSVIRVSGPQSGVALKTLTRLKSLPEPRKALLKKLYDLESKDVIDRGLILWFPGPASFTGEDCCEFQVHGSTAVISGVLRSLRRIEQVGPAEPGEFTRRAFLNGKMDLTEVEGLADLLHAQTELQRKQAYLQSEGVLSKVYTRWRDSLIRCLAHVEAVIDFDETEDLDENISAELVSNVRRLREAMSRHLELGRQGEVLRTGVQTVIVGEPNVGKSSLLNNLCQKPKAIVSPVEGTTRDLLETTLDIGGYPVIVTDTAGLRTRTQDLVEREGIRRARDSMATADFILFLVDANKVVNFYKSYHKTYATFFEEYIKSLLSEHSEILNKRMLIILNKSDLIDVEMYNNFEELVSKENKITLFSCKSNQGRTILLDKITEHLKILCGNPSREQPSMSQERHRHHLEGCVRHLQDFLGRASSSEGDLVLKAEDLRLATRQLAKLTGHITTEDLLHVIFRDFCIGK